MPLLVEHGRPAALVNMASMAGFMATRDRTPYVMSKHAVVALTEAIRCQLADLHPHVHAMLVAPGPVATPLLEAAERQGDWRPDAPPIQPAAVASRILRALDAGEFYVFTNTSSEARISARMEEILAGCRVTNELAALAAAQ